MKAHNVVLVHAAVRCVVLFGETAAGLLSRSRCRGEWA